MTDLLTRLLALAELAVDEALEYDYGDPDDRHIWREPQELKPLVAAALAQPETVGHQVTAKRAIESCLAQRDEVVAAFIAKHGFQPEDAIQGDEPQLITRHGPLNVKEGDLFIFNADQGHAWVSNGACVMVMATIAKQRQGVAA